MTRDQAIWFGLGSIFASGVLYALPLGAQGFFIGTVIGTIIVWADP